MGNYGDLFVPFIYFCFLGRGVFKAFLRASSKVILP